MAEAHFIKHCEKITVIQYHKKSPHNFPATKLKDMKYYHLTERIQNSCYEEIQHPRKLRQLNELRNTINEQEHCTKETEIIRRTRKILELNSLSEVKNILEKHWKWRRVKKH